MPWLKIVETPPVPASVQAWNLGAGESAVLSYALAHPGVQAIIDDLAGRRCAVVHHVEVRGCVGLVLVAKQRGLVPAGAARGRGAARGGPVVLRRRDPPRSCPGGRVGRRPARAAFI